MNRKIVSQMFLCAAALLFVAVGVSHAAMGAAFMGTWQFNEAKSKVAAGGEKNSTVAYTMSGDSVTCTIDGTDATGQPLHSVWTGKFDGKDYPVTGDPASDMRSYRMINSHTVAATESKGGKVIGRVRIVVSADGKTRTVTSHTTDAKGMSVVSVAVYDKQ